MVSAFLGFVGRLFTAIVGGIVAGYLVLKYRDRFDEIDQTIAEFKEWVNDRIHPSEEPRWKTDVDSEGREVWGVYEGHEEYPGDDFDDLVDPSDEFNDLVDPEG